ncbi:hypothetical protein [Oceanicola sp. 22II-s10i]|uniref:hypothetical protein n=1 Tax=Oceanicola sp. 22II-s10i TaxID=1317116 RepID=UPI000B524B5E|nr:hypothetical protein [Oceanicola sp. 22II-s10i]
MTAMTMIASRPASAWAPERLLVVADRVGATQEISFAQPLASRPGDMLVYFDKNLRQKEAIRARFDYVQPTLLVLSRYTYQNGLYWAQLARQAGIPVIFHIDDDLLQVPMSLGPEKYAAYNDPARLKALRDNMEACDLLYASTAPLAEDLRGHGIRVPIVAGDIYCSVDLDTAPPLPPATGPVIGYMGSGGHAADLEMIEGAIARLMLRFPTLRFEIFGTLPIPRALQPFSDRVGHVTPGMLDYDDFIALLRRLGWWIGLAPLEDNRFNRCKADTKWVEYSQAGIPVVASDLPVYHRACAGGAGFLAGDEEAWYGYMERLILDPGRRAETTSRAAQRLKTVYQRENLTRQVLEIFGQVRDLTLHDQVTTP